MNLRKHKNIDKHLVSLGFKVTSNGKLPGSNRIVIIGRQQEDNIEKVIVIESNSSQIEDVKFGIKIKWIESLFNDYVRFIVGETEESTPTQSKATLANDLDDAHNMSLYYNFHSEQQVSESLTTPDVIDWISQKNQSCFLTCYENLEKYYLDSEYINLLPSYNFNWHYFIRVFFVYSKYSSEDLKIEIEALARMMTKLNLINSLFLNNIKEFNYYAQQKELGIENKLCQFLKFLSQYVDLNKLIRQKEILESLLNGIATSPYIER